jgi:hypothetical protein
MNTEQEMAGRDVVERVAGRGAIDGRVTMTAQERDELVGWARYWLDRPPGQQEPSEGAIREVVRIPIVRTPELGMADRTFLLKRSEASDMLRAAYRVDFGLPVQEQGEKP